MSFTTFPFPTADFANRHLMALRCRACPAGSANFDAPANGEKAVATGCE
jgi:hypothetical protein